MVDIEFNPPWSRLPLVHDETNRFPDPTMEAIGESPELGAVIEGAVAAIRDGYITDAEAARTGAESARTGAEAARTVAELAHVAVANLALEVESASATSVAARTGAESARTGAESARASSEAARIAAELARDLSLAGQFKGASLNASSDLNTLKTEGVYRQNSGGPLALGYPLDNFYGSIVIYARAPGGAIQIAYKHNASSRDPRRFYMRMETTTGWTAWSVFSSRRIDKTAGLAIYDWDDLADRDQLIYGDTGWRNVAALLTNGWTVSGANVMIRRAGAMVSLKLVGLDRTNATSDAFMDSISGFRHQNAQGWQTYARSDSSIGYIREQSGVIALVGRTLGAGALTYATFQWMTDDAWPASLPGTAIGTIPNL